MNKDTYNKELAIWLQNRLNRCLEIDEWHRPQLEQLVKDLLAAK